MPSFNILFERQISKLYFHFVLFSMVIFISQSFIPSGGDNKNSMSLCYSWLHEVNDKELTSRSSHFLVKIEEWDLRDEGDWNQSWLIMKKRIEKES